MPGTFEKQNSYSIPVTVNDGLLLSFIEKIFNEFRREAAGGGKWSIQARAEFIGGGNGDETTVRDLEALVAARTDSVQRRSLTMNQIQRNLHSTHCFTAILEGANLRTWVESESETLANGWAATLDSKLQHYLENPAAELKIASPNPLARVWHVVSTNPLASALVAGLVVAFLVFLFNWN